MKKVLAGLVVVAAVVVAIVLIAGGGSGEGYVVRAVFENGSFMVPGEQVRVAGANVGTIKSVSVSLPGEPTAEEGGKLVDVPGKAILELEITDPSFQDFRQDAGCEIRPQSLIGEKYVNCHPTEPRAPGEQPPPPLRQIPAGEPGAGQYLLPLGHNQTTVDPDLINNINSLPYAQRFRLIFNELGAGLAGRGQDLEAAIKKANPTLRSVDKLFGELTEQKNELARLAAESQEILEPLTREKEHVVGFLAHSGEAAEASSEHGAELEAALRKFPTFLVEFRETMRNLKEFSDAGTPLLKSLGVAAPSLTDATRTLTPFSEATTVALKSLATAGEASGPVFAQSVPVVKKAGKLAKTGVVPTKELAALFGSLEETKGWQRLTELIYNSTAAFNGFDKYGHYGRALVTLGLCLEYKATEAGQSSCSARFNGPFHSEPQNASASVAQLLQLLRERRAEQSGGTSTGEEGSTATTGLSSAHSAEPSAPAERVQGEREEETGLGEARQTEGGTEPLLDYLLGQ
ncbi:MAG TPA: MlaD family protein [Solirubrobacterales bacterium]|nr:MlaD family protein [Solirubrobacterales bacterium]